MTEPVVFESDDTETGKVMRIFMAGNGDWYVSIGPKEERLHENCVRIRTSGGASFRCPGLSVAIANAYDAIRSGEEAGTLGHDGFAL